MKANINPELERAIANYLDGTASPEERKIVDCFYASFQDKPDITVKLSRQYKDEIRERMRASVLKNMQFTKRRTWHHILSSTHLKIAIAAFFLVLMGFSMLLYRAGKFPWQDSEFIALHGRLPEIILEDGTRVKLNGNSRLIYPKSFRGDSVREVSLIGEAFFQVAKDKGRPFHIHTHRMEISVLGTSFNVKDYADDPHAETILVEGKVSVRKQGAHQQSYILAPNERFAVDTQGQQHAINTQGSLKQAVVSVTKLDQQKLDETSAAVSWHTGKVLIKDERLIDIAKKLERIYGVKIFILDSDLEHTRYSAAFEGEEIGNILRGLQLVSPFRFEIRDDKRIDIYK